MKQDKMLLNGSMVCFTVLSLSFLLMAPLPGGKESRMMDILAGLSFWLSLLAGIVCQVSLSVRRKRWEQKTGVKTQGPIGLISFCATPQGKLADLLLVVSLVGFAVSMWLTQSNGFICYLFLGFTVLAFFAHCVYNSKNYSYMLIRKKRKSGRRARQRGINDEKQQNHT